MLDAVIYVGGCTATVAVLYAWALHSVFKEMRQRSLDGETEYQSWFPSGGMK